MARTARIVLPNHPHHVTQRGNRRQPVFFNDGDYRLYKAILQEEAFKQDLALWGYCLMPNHVHIIAVPKVPEALSLTFKETHRRYTRFVNKREGWTGYLWQGRFASYAMEEPHAIMALRYVDNNPVDSGQVNQAVDYPWSSARAHCGIAADPLLSPHPFEAQIKDWHEFLEEGRRPDIAKGAQALVTEHLASGDTLK